MAIRVGGGQVRSLPGPVQTDIRTLNAAEFANRLYDHPVRRVRSVIVEREWNYVLLPEAPGFQASVQWVEPFRFDERLFSFVTGR
jgi:hypothetical protein